MKQTKFFKLEPKVKFQIENQNQNFEIQKVDWVNNSKIAASKKSEPKMFSLKLQIPAWNPETPKSEIRFWNKNFENFLSENKIEKIETANSETEFIGTEWNLEYLASSFFDGIESTLSEIK